MTNAFVVVIPARHASTRLPAKPLADIAGVPMVVRVAQRARSSGASEVIVATDDRRVVDVTDAYGIRSMLTDPQHRSGSDRVMEVVARAGLAADAVVVNVQGDEPLIPPGVIDQVAQRLHADPDIGVATLCEPIASVADLQNPNVVKVVRDLAGRALYFTRAPVPWWRDGFVPDRMPGSLPAGSWWRHIGIYGYRVKTLETYCRLPPSDLEQWESLEQLRLLSHGIPIAVDPAVAAVPAGVDTPEDLERVRRMLGGA